MTPSSRRRISSSQPTHATARDIPAGFPLRQLPPRPPSTRGAPQSPLLFVLSRQPSPQIVFPPVTPRRHARACVATLPATSSPRAVAQITRFPLSPLAGQCRRPPLRASVRAPAIIAATSPAAKTPRPATAAGNGSRGRDGTGCSPRSRPRRHPVPFCPSVTPVNASFQCSRRDLIAPACAGPRAASAHGTPVSTADNETHCPPTTLRKRTATTATPEGSLRTGRPAQAETGRIGRRGKRESGRTARTGQQEEKPDRQLRRKRAKDARGERRAKDGAGDARVRCAGEPRDGD